MVERNGAVGPSERANRRLLAMGGAIGGAVGLALAFLELGESASGGTRTTMMDGPLPMWLAVAIALAWGVLLPIVSWRWHRVVDEHERQAYRDGAVAGYYVMGVGAPVWWFLWRGGLAPAVDALWLFLGVMIVSSVVWLWRKYR